ncbi:ABC transporter substrate-binding protein [Gaiella sp.]|uniref:ABC transporter substrate-binding protein n=1 Tax=Gaiella sp. TaxID=2663207 RepID=UPI0032670FB1
MSRALRFTLALSAVALFATAAAFAATSRTHASDTFVFGTEGDPVLVDGALVSDGPSLRAVNQMFEGLVGLKAGTTKVVPSLATSWTTSKNGLAWTFKLRQGVKFHDGTKMDAKSVCFNFSRNYKLPGYLQGESTNYYWVTVFGGYAKPATGNPGPDKSLYRGCKVVNASTARIILTRPSSSFLAALALPSFAIASPAALVKYKADAGSVGSDGSFRPTGTFGTSNPVGTGPFKFESWRIGDKLVMVRNDSYWGTKAKLKKLIFRPITDSTARLQALQSGELDGANLLAPQDVPSVSNSSSLKVLSRPAFNIGYVGMNQKQGPLSNIKVRQAVAYGLDKKAVVGAFYGGRGQVANQFMPPLVEGYAKKGVPDYSYNPAKAKALLQEAGLTLPVTLEFWYPTDRPRGYMPDPPRNFQAFAASLEKSGFKIVPKPGPWRGGYLSGVQSGKAALYLLGWTGDFGDPANFLNVHFGAAGDLFGFNNPALFKALQVADAEPNLDKRTKLYQAASIQVMKFLPMVPYANASPALGFKKNVKGYVPSPVEVELFTPVSIG